MNLQISADRLADRRNLLRSFDTLNREVDRTGITQAMDSFESQAFDLILSRAREVFDVSREDQRVQDFYGPSNLARQMLLARRLCEAGVGFVTVHYGNWDHHGDIVGSMNSVAPQLDHAVARFRSGRQSNVACKTTSCWSFPANSAGRRASTAVRAGITGRRCRRWPLPAAA